MTARLVILGIVAGCLAITAAVKVSKTSGHDHIEIDDGEMTQEELDRIRDLQKNLKDYDLPGEEPAERPEFQVHVEVNNSSNKNRLDFWITETHGYYVETMRMNVWYKDTPSTTLEDSSLWFEHYMDKYIPAGEELRECLEVVPAELEHVGGDMGATENWAAEIISHNRARTQDPDPLPRPRFGSKCE